LYKSTGLQKFKIVVEISIGVEKESDRPDGITYGEYNVYFYSRTPNACT